jgi:hypothetical protein
VTRKQDTLRFSVGAPEGPRSPVWRLWANKNTSDVYLAARAIADQAKVSFHKSGKWRIGFTEQYANRPNPYVQPGEDRATDKWQRPPEVAPGITRAFFVMVPASELTVHKVASKFHPDTVWVPPAPIGRATCFTIFFISPAVDITNIRGIHRSVTRSVGHIRLPNGEIVWVVEHDQPMTEAQKAALTQGRVDVARSEHHQGRSPEEFNFAFLYSYEEGVSYYIVVSDKGLPSTTEGW